MVRIYIEGGGNSKELRTRCRLAFAALFEKAGFKGRMPRVVACGGRGETYDDFCTALKQKRGYVILLVDSEQPLVQDSWSHLRERDGWERPSCVEDDQAQLMVTCMESWVMADRDALRSAFRTCLTEGSLLSPTNLESKSKEDVQDSLERATQNCGRDKKYQKGRRSFQVLELLEPETLKQSLPHFRSLVKTLENKV